ncbi:O-antigen biosynthesis glycosyltransferase WbnK [Folsomia candida]|uniref:O-antigen biosynthesis glycosyltransferase WbnK n=1 Tax=Folsomia candida TaxID=158441 RepID=UPI000B8F5B35|nr:O-antigen biosynthesis glycosyltransferase WbnK [Folsomia candida]
MLRGAKFSSITKCVNYIFYKHLTKRRLVFILGLAVLVVVCLDYRRRWDWTELPPPGVIVEKVGGLGNQLFIYACMYSLARKMGLPIYLEIPSARLFKPQSDPFYNFNARPFVLHKFRVFYDQAVEGWYSSDYPLNRHVLRVDDRDLLYQAEKPLPSDKLIIIKDYCQSEVFFKDYIPEIKEMFQLQMTPEELARPPFRHWIDLISAAGENSVAIHIRRGDYAKLENNYGENYWLTPISFYQRGMKMMFEKLNVSKDVSFFVFSDQINDVRAELLRGFQLPANAHLHFVSCYRCTTSLEDFYLMTMCKHMISANSTFSWWAAYLNKNAKKVIIAPAFHPQTLTIHPDAENRKFKEYEMTLFYPEEWIVLDAFKNEIMG